MRFGSSSKQKKVEILGRGWLRDLQNLNFKNFEKSSKVLPKGGRTMSK